MIDSVAREPEVADLCHMLVAMGARLDGIGSSTLTVEGVERLLTAGRGRHTRVADSRHVDRGYPLFAETLHSLGADVSRVEVVDPTGPGRD